MPITATSSQANPSLLQQKPIMLTQKGEVLKISTDMDKGIMVRDHIVPKKQEKPCSPLTTSRKYCHLDRPSHGLIFITHRAMGAEQINMIVHLKAA